MTHSPNLRFFNGFRGGGDKQPKATPPTTDTSNQPDNVQGWLMNVHTYRDSEAISTTTTATIVDEDNNCIPTENIRKNRNGRPESIASEDSVNLDELINANFTGDMDDEKDLPDLAALDLDDSTDDFWKMDNNELLGNFDSEIRSYASTNKFLTNAQLDWSPTDTKSPNDNIKSCLPVTLSSEFAPRHKRSDSVSSENSLTSQSTITPYPKFGLTPMTYPSESSSSSSRSPSRLSNYSTASSTTTSGIPHPRTNSSANGNTTTGGIPTPSRSFTLRDKNSSHLLSPSNHSKKGSTQPRTQLAKRASHIPAPASYTTASPPSPQRTISSSGLQQRRIPTPHQQQKRIPQRASHIPTVRESIHRPGSPLLPPQGRASATPSRIGMRSPTPGGPRNSLFQSTNTKPKDQEKRGLTPTSSRPSGLRPPGSVPLMSSPNNNARSVSRIGTFKKSS